MGESYQGPNIQLCLAVTKWAIGIRRSQSHLNLHVHLASDVHFSNNLSTSFPAVCRAWKASHSKTRCIVSRWSCLCGCCMVVIMSFLSLSRLLRARKYVTAAQALICRSCLSGELDLGLRVRFTLACAKFVKSVASRLSSAASMVAFL